MTSKCTFIEISPNTIIGITNLIIITTILITNILIPNNLIIIIHQLTPMAVNLLQLHTKKNYLRDVQYYDLIIIIHQLTPMAVNLLQLHTKKNYLRDVQYYDPLSLRYQRLSKIPTVQERLDLCTILFITIHISTKVAMRNIL
ncbi:hypothetical protein RMCBS344292_03675 [Rhizopus microsporus]|nr:hypothetical protein RMCBS344292_03675 [Rhizopus microsporus]